VESELNWNTASFEEAVVVTGAVVEAEEAEEEEPS